MNEIDIQIIGLENISNELQLNFFEEFSRRLNEITEVDTLNDRISKSLISTLYKKPTDMLQQYKRIKKAEENNICSICLQCFKENEYKREVICKHNFHKKCIDKWINKYNNFSCPTCRCNLFSKVQQEICFQNLHQ